MSQSAFHTSGGSIQDAYDFNENYIFLKKLIRDLKVENGSSLRKDLFGEDETGRILSKKEMKQLFRFLRKIEHHYEECCSPPIPEELENSIRAKKVSDRLPWEMEAIQKAEEWRAEVREKKSNCRMLLDEALEKVKKGESI